MAATRVSEGVVGKKRVLPIFITFKRKSTFYFSVLGRIRKRIKKVFITLSSVAAKLPVIWKRKQPHGKQPDERWVKTNLILEYNLPISPFVASSGIA